MATTKKNTGINKKKFSKIITALDEYAKTVSKNVNVDATKSQISRAIKGTATEASVNSWVAGIQEKCTKFIMQLNQYKDLLDQIENSYATNDTNNTSFSDALKAIQNGEWTKGTEE